MGSLNQTKKTIRIMKSLVVLCISLFAFAADAIGEGLGIYISHVLRRDNSITLKWETDLPPPYLVALFTPFEAGFGTRPKNGTRCLKYHMSNYNYCCFQGDFKSLKGDVYVQVMTPDVTNSPYFCEMSAGEIEEYKGRLKDLLDFRNPIVDDAVPAGELQMELIGDHLWGGFWVSDTPYVTVNGKCKGFQNMSTNLVQDSLVQEHSYYSNTLTGVTSTHRYETYTNDVESLEYTTFTNVVKVIPTTSDGLQVRVFEQAIQPLGNVRHDRRGITKSYDPKVGVTNFVAQMRYYETGQRQYGPYDTSVGTGYRIYYHDTDDDFYISRAYSKLPNCSEKVVLRRTIKALSVYKNRKIGLDWLGQLRFVSTTNGVGQLIYWQGL